MKQVKGLQTKNNEISKVINVVVYGLEEEEINLVENS